MRRILLAFVLLMTASSAAYSQLLSTDVAFPTDASIIVITVDATKGNQGLLNHTASDVYVHTGVITNLSSSPTNWRYVKFNQDFNSPNAALQATPHPTDANKWQFTITNIRAYYGVPANETILRVSILFRSGNGQKKQANIDGSDMYIKVYAANELAVKFTSPAMQPTFNPIPEPLTVGTPPFSVPVTAVASKNVNLSVTFNGSSIASANAVQTVSGTANVTTTCEQQLIAVADDNGTIKRDTFNFFVPQASNPTGARPAGRKDGITFEDNNTKAVFILYAPLKTKVSLVGDFNNWQQTCSGQMKKDGDYFWTEVTGLTPGTAYRFQYIVDDAIRIADPYSELVLDPNNDQYIQASTYPNMPQYPTGKTTGGIVGVITPGETAYNWTSNSYVRPDKRDLMIYELLVRDFGALHSWQMLKDTLNYIKNLGFNAVQLMPINEFDGNESWGYNPMYFFAPDKYYGSKNALKAFIDQAHSLGIAVIQDIAFNHATGQSPLAAMWWNAAANQTAANNPYFYETAQHPFNVFHDFNHNVEPTKYHVARFIRHWLTEYRIDGFRWDLSKGFTNNFTTDVTAWNLYSQDRINIWQRYYDSMQVVSPGSYCILEHLGNDDEEAELAKRGMMLWGIMNYQFAQNTKGYSSGADITRAFWKNRNNWNTTTFNDKPYLITYAESHDEQRIMFENINSGNTANAAHNVKDTTIGLYRTEAMAAVLMGLPGPKMIWQFGELGYDYDINFNGRTGNKPIRWDYFQQVRRKRLYQVFSAMAKLRNQFKNTFRTPDLALGTSLGSNLVKTIVVDHADLKYVVVANFDVVQQTPTVTFPANGTFYDYTNGGTITVSGNQQAITLQPGEYKVYLNQNISGGVVTNVRDVLASKADFSLSVYPNPVRGTATVKYELPKSGKVSVQLINMQGQVLVSKNMGFQLKGFQLFELDRNSIAGTPLKAGQYVLQVRVDNLVRYEKVMVQQ
ncbi:putative secreted protein (Por secretion system target) [Lacibacter cauensis]|uniref:Putative secreted protein (Por secretion system target) n=1 Tax=Lacibacter cauensis TaxID=510947 RepID=A0A562SJU9_9BACT|nr:alpha-amylase family glycosyl hydrolase [Lacibacter cauensis]TWI81535.1 putative secreted protein (Por secretion system target) [Lacibacter cauensis]